jgi:hypothetical protein
VSTALQVELKMNTSILNYPGFQNLPKGARQMLLVSEAHFFDESGSHPAMQNPPAPDARANCGFKVLLTSMLVALAAVLR